MQLSPTQQRVYSELEDALKIGSIFVVWSKDGFGKTTILREFHSKHGGEFLTLKPFIDMMRTQDALKMEETLESLLMDAMKRNDLVIMDDLNLINDVICGCGYFDAYPRKKFVNAILTAVAEYAVENGKKLVFGNQGDISEPIESRAYSSGLKKFTVEDYAFLCEAILGQKASKLDFKKIHRFAPKLNAHQLRSACEWHRHKDCDTEIFIEYLRSRRMASNVDIGEVEAVDLNSLRGVDDVIEALEAHICLPLENDAIASELQIRPKRGVLLAGPPGTGKTTVGRALAHRLRSKFFLIDGTFIAGSDDFYRKIAHVFEAAKQNAPAIIFIDDSDVIFEDKEEHGLYRYLLTMLDGLEGESNKRVCVMMTTMDIASVPPALIRSGRIELWLETRLPDEEAREKILSDLLQPVPEAIRPKSIKDLVAITEELTGADLRRLIEDGKVLYAFDKARNQPIKPMDDYYAQAVETIRSNKEKYANAEDLARERYSGSGGGGHSSTAARTRRRIAAAAADESD